MTNPHHEERVVLTGRLAEFRQAREDEIKAVQKEGQASILLENGRTVHHPGSDFWYEFSIDFLPAAPPDTPCALIIGSSSYYVTIVRYTESTIVLASDNELPEILTKAQLEINAIALLEKLIKRIELSADKPNPAGERLLDITKAQENTFSQDIPNFEKECDNEKLVEQQRMAVHQSIKNDITFIWGPPGTGKTKVIGQIIFHLMQANRTVLLASHTNKAVDGAIRKAVEKCHSSLTSCSTTSDSKTPCPILRLGKTADKLPDQVKLDNHIAALGAELKIKIDKLKAAYSQEIETLGKTQNQIAILRWINQTGIDSLKSLNSQHMNTLVLAQKYQEHINELTEGIQNRREDIEQYNAHKKLLQQEADCQAKLKRLTSQLDAAKSLYQTLPLELQNAKDAIIKHKRLKVLSKAISEQLSPRAQQQQLDSVKTSLVLLEQAQAKKSENLRANQLKLAEMDNKGAIAKLFQSKKEHEHIRQLVSLMASELSVINKKIETMRALQKEYEGRLEELLLQIEEQKSIKVGNTEEYWVAAVAAHESEIRKLSASIPGLEEQTASFAFHLQSIQLQMEPSKNAYDAVSMLMEQLSKAKQTLEALHNKSEEFRSLYIKAASAEMALLPSKYASNLSGIESSDFLDGLSDMLSEAKTSAAGLDLIALLEQEAQIKNRMDDQQTQISKLNEEYEALTVTAIKQAQVIGTTLTRTYLNDVIQSRVFDTVIIDEASMAPIPALWCAAALAGRNIVIVGDFLQLPPIVMATTQAARDWLGKDIFDQSGIKAGARRGAEKPPCLVMLNEQFRMESQIAEIANIYYQDYKRLESNDTNKERVKARNEFLQWYSNPFPSLPDSSVVQLIDTSKLGAWVTTVPQGKKASRVNYLSASIAVELAFCLIQRKLESARSEGFKPPETPSVLIVSPYGPHTKRVRELIRLGYRTRGFSEQMNLPFIEAGTIHQFQGSEADIVIFDMVVDEPHWRANLFMPDSMMGDSLKQMYNVAVTRARFRLFVLGNIPYLKSRANNNATGVFLDKLINGLPAPVISAKDHFDDVIDKLPVKSISFPRIMVKGRQFTDHLVKDIQNCRSLLVIFSPFMTESRVSELLKVIDDVNTRGCRIIIVTKAMSDRQSLKQKTIYTKCETLLKQHGASIIYKKAMHEKFVFIDHKVFWSGSLNVLSFSGTTGEFMERCQNEDYVLKVEHMFELSKYESGCIEGNTNSCVFCHGPMVIRDGYKGIYWKCDNPDCPGK